jgi:hypothetical protein
MQADLSERSGQTATAMKEMGMEDERAAIRGILIFLAVLVALGVALLVSATILIATTGNAPPEESLVRVIVQLMPRPYWYY